jgi:hypothetical protein
MSQAGGSNSIPIGTCNLPHWCNNVNNDYIQNSDNTIYVFTSVPLRTRLHSAHPPTHARTHSITIIWLAPVSLWSRHIYQHSVTSLHPTLSLVTSRRLVEHRVLDVALVCESKETFQRLLACGRNKIKCNAVNTRVPRLTAKWNSGQ